MKNLEKDQIIKGLVGVIILLVVFGGVYINKKNKTDIAVNLGEEDNLVSTTTTTNTMSNVATNKVTNKPKTTTLPSGKCNLKITSPVVGSKVDFPLTIIGTIDHSDLEKYGCVWDEVFTRAGTAQVFYNVRNSGWKSQGVAVPITTSATTYTSSTSTISFSIGLNFFNAGVGLPSGSPIKITFVENNEKDHTPLDTFDFTVYLK